MGSKSVGLLNIVFGADLRGFDRAMKKAQKSITKFGKKMGNIGKKLATNVTLPIIGLGAAAVKMAADFEETDSKFKTVFSSIQKQAEDTAKTFKESFGLSEKAAKQLLSDTGDLLVGFGFTEQAALDLSKNVNELAVDLSSFTNFSGGAEGASLALTKALLGERESIKSLGIAITEADLKSFAAEQGLVWKELDRIGKANLTFQLAMKQSSKAVGDYSRTSGSLTNQSRALGFAIQDLSVEFGTIFIPFAKSLVSTLKDVVSWMSNLSLETKESILKWGLVVAAIGPALFIFGQMAIAVSALIPVFAALWSIMIANPIGLILTSVAALVGGFYWLITSSSDTARTIRNAFVFMANGIINSINLIIKGLNKINPFKQIKPIKQFSFETKKEFKGVEDGAKDAAKEIGKLSTAVTTTPTGGVPTTPTGGGTTAPSEDQFSPVLDVIETDFLFNMSAVDESLDNLITNTGFTFKTIEEQAAEATQKMAEGFLEFANKVKQVMSGIGDVISATNAKEQAEFDIWKERQTEKVDILDGEMERKLERVEESNMSDEEKAAKKLEIEEAYADKKDAIDEQIDNKEKAMKKRQAIRDKAMKIASAIMSTAEAVAANIGIPPLAALIGALGAAQVAAIASTPIPFKMGGLVSGPTLGLIGEGSGTSAFNPEVVSPLDKLMGMMGATQVDVHGRIAGDNIVLVSDKAEISRQRFI